MMKLLMCCTEYKPCGLEMHQDLAIPHREQVSGMTCFVPEDVLLVVLSNMACLKIHTMRPGPDSAPDFT